MHAARCVFVATMFATCKNSARRACAVQRLAFVQGALPSSSLLVLAASRVHVIPKIAAPDIPLAWDVL